VTRDADIRVLAFAPALPDWWVISRIDLERIVWHERTPVVGWLTVEVNGTTEVHPAVVELGGQPMSAYYVYGADRAHGDVCDVYDVVHASQLAACTCGRLPDSPPDAWWCRECGALIPGSPELPGLNTA